MNIGYGGIPVVLRSPRPFTEPVYVDRVYGNPWRAEHGWRHGQHDWHEWREERHERHHHEHGDR